MKRLTEINVRARRKMPSSTKFMHSEQFWFKVNHHFVGWFFVCVQRPVDEKCPVAFRLGVCRLFNGFSRSFKYVCKVALWLASVCHRPKCDSAKKKRAWTVPDCTHTARPQCDVKHRTFRSETQNQAKAMSPCELKNEIRRNKKLKEKLTLEKCQNISMISIKRKHTHTHTREWQRIKRKEWAKNHCMIIILHTQRIFTRHHTLYTLWQTQNAERKSNKTKKKKKIIISAKSVYRENSLVGMCVRARKGFYYSRLHTEQQTVMLVTVPITPGNNKKLISDLFLCPKHTCTRQYSK